MQLATEQKMKMFVKFYLLQRVEGARVRVRATVKLLAAFLNDESSITIGPRGGGGGGGMKVQ